MNSEFVSVTQEFPFLPLKLAIYLKVNYVNFSQHPQYLEQELADYNFDWAIGFLTLGGFFVCVFFYTDEMIPHTQFHFLLLHLKSTHYPTGLILMDNNNSLLKGILQVST